MEKRPAQSRSEWPVPTPYGDDIERVTEQSGLRESDGR